MPETGQTISHYRILEKIGVGGMGEVYLADDTTLFRIYRKSGMPGRINIKEKNLTNLLHRIVTVPRQELCEEFVSTREKLYTK